MRLGQCPSIWTFFLGKASLKENVVLNLAKNLDTECIAGIKAKSLLERDGSSSASSASSPARTPAPTPPPARTPAPSPPPARPSASKGRTSPPSTPPRPQHGSPSPHQPSSPPGFPPTPQYPAPVSPYHNSPHIQVSQIHYNSTGGSTYLSPVSASANIQMLRDVFNDADINNDLNHERCALFMHDENGELETDVEGKNTFYHSEGYLYRSDHGRDKCSRVQCLQTKDDVPINCGYHHQFVFPVFYKPCGPGCRGAYCSCLRSYIDYN